MPISKCVDTALYFPTISLLSFINRYKEPTITYTNIANIIHGVVLKYASSLLPMATDAMQPTIMRDENAVAALCFMLFLLIYVHFFTSIPILIIQPKSTDYNENTVAKQKM